MGSMSFGSRSRSLLGLSFTGMLVLSTGCAFWNFSDWDDLAVAGDASVDAGVVGDSDAAAPLVLDTFTRNLASGLGSADIGGAWDLAGLATAFSVDGKGHYALPPGQSISARIFSTLPLDLDLTATYSIAQIPDSACYLNLKARVKTDDSYSLSLRISKTESPRLKFETKANQSLAQALVPSISNAAGAEIILRFQVSGANPTKLRGKAWNKGSTEPAWLVEVDQGDTALQTAGGVSFGGYVTPVTGLPDTNVSVDDFTVRPLK